MKTPLRAALYDWLMAPLERAFLGQQRGELVQEARGRVLEIGAGTGANLPFYPELHHLIVAEPDGAMAAALWEKQRRLDPSPRGLVRAVGEHLPFPRRCFDSVVCTLVLCSVQEPHRVMSEILRVLRPGGKLIFLEHVRGEGRRGWWQDRLAPAWKFFSGGCHPNRRTVEGLSRAGFRVGDVHHFDPSERLSGLSWLGCRITIPFVRGIAFPANSSASRD